MSANLRLNSFNEMVGKTVASVNVRKILKSGDDEPFLDITFTDGSVITIEADYGGYTGKSEGEYPRFIRVLQEANKR